MFYVEPKYTHRNPKIDFDGIPCCAVKHMESYPASKLDPHTKGILEGVLTHWLCEYRRMLNTIGNREGYAGFVAAFASDVADVKRCLLELEAARS